MRNKPENEKQAWYAVKSQLAKHKERVCLGQHWSYNIHHNPKRLAFVLSRYKFAAKMSVRNNRVLELGCSEGLGASVLAEFADRYVGVDLDEEAINAAKLVYTSKSWEFICQDFLGDRFGVFDSVVSMDVVEHIEKEQEHLFWQTVYSNLDEDGVAVIGTPNLTAETFASEASRAGHVNLFDAKRLRSRMEMLFHNVFLFSMNDEIVHTGFAPMAHFLIVVGCSKRGRLER